MDWKTQPSFFNPADNGFQMNNRDEGMEEKRGHPVPDDFHPFRAAQDKARIGVIDFDVSQILRDDGHAIFPKPDGIRKRLLRPGQFGAHYPIVKGIKIFGEGAVVGG